MMAIVVLRRIRSYICSSKGLIHQGSALPPGLMDPSETLREPDGWNDVLHNPDATAS